MVLDMSYSSVNKLVHIIGRNSNSHLLNSIRQHEPVNRLSCICAQQTRTMRLYRERTVRAMYWRGRSFDRVQYPELRPEMRLDWNYRSEIFAFSRRLQENLSEDVLRKLFTHKPYADNMRLKEAKLGIPESKLESNSNFVIRGKELLDICLKPYLRYNYDSLPEEGIEAIANYLKSEAVLADVAKWIGCRDTILTIEWPPSPKTMSDTVCALLAAIESDLDLNRVRRFVVDMIVTYLHDKNILDDVWTIPHPKETLNLILQNSNLPSYEPRIIFQTGVKTIEPCHVIGIYVDKKFLGSSPGETLTIAEECAVLNSFERMFDLTENRAPFIYGQASEAIDYTAYQKEHTGLKEWKISDRIH